MSILELQDVSYGYIDGNKKRMILNKLSYAFEKGRFYSIFGPSGSGKTTLLSIAGGLEKTQEGRIAYQGEDINKIGLSKYRRDKLSFVFQQFNLIPYLTALENVLNIMHITNNELPKPYEKTALNLLKQFGITESKARRSIHKLSGGEQQRVAIARGLATNVDLILTDEPTGNLDAETEKEIIKILSSLARDYGKCVIAVSHSEAISYSSDIHLVLDHGKLHERQVDRGKGDKNE